MSQTLSEQDLLSLSRAHNLFTRQMRDRIIRLDFFDTLPQHRGNVYATAVELAARYDLSIRTIYKLVAER